MEEENIIENEDIIESDDDEGSESENLDKKQTKQIKKSLRFAENEESDKEDDDEDEDEDDDESDDNNFEDDDDDDDFEEDTENDEKHKKKENVENDKNTFHMELSDDSISDTNDDDDIEEDENYLQKFNENMKKKIIDEYHPELFSHNYKEVDALSTVFRDKDGNIIDPLHKTMPFVTKYEKARIIGERAKQIDSGAIPFIEIEDNIIDGYLIALKEYQQKKIPFIIRRPLPDGTSEYWKLKDLEILE